MLTTLTTANIYEKIRNYELHSYMANKCIEYSENFLEDNYEILKNLNVDRM